MFFDAKTQHFTGFFDWKALKKRIINYFILTKLSRFQPVLDENQTGLCIHINYCFLVDF